MTTAPATRTPAVEVERPGVTYRTNPDAPWDPIPVEDDVPGLTGEPSADRCQARACCHGAATPAAIGWVETSHEDGYGRESEGISWVTPWRIADGRLVCEDCSTVWDEGGDVDVEPEGEA